jgi:signal transduction protein with GAF and PtsI domain
MRATQSFKSVLALAVAVTEVVGAPGADAPAPSALTKFIGKLRRNEAPQGIAASPGIALGPAFVYRPAALVVHRPRADDPAAEWARFQDAASTALQQLAELRRKAVAEVGEAEAAIFDVHRMIIH